MLKENINSNTEMDNIDTETEVEEETNSDLLKDPHIARACYAFEVSPRQVTPTMRQVGKLMNYALQYGLVIKSDNNIVINGHRCGYCHKREVTHEDDWCAKCENADLNSQDY